VAFRAPVSPRARVLLPVVATLVVLVILLLLFTGIYTDLLLFRSVGYVGVFTTVLRTRLLLFVVAALVVSVFACGNAVIAYQVRPPFRPASLEQQNLDRYRMAVEPRLRLLLVGLGAALALAAGGAAQGRWQTWLLWRNGTSFGIRDPQFGRDVSYYAFTLPMERFVLGLGFQAVLLALVVATATHYLFGGIRLQTPGDKLVPAAKAHLSVLVGIFVLLKAVAYYLDRFGLNFSRRGFVDTGASATDITAVLPVKTILIVVSVLCALLFFANARLRGWALPGISLGLLVIGSVVAGGLVPAAYQQFSVKPNEISKERPYIERNIAQTRLAYGLGAEGVTTTPYQVTPETASVRSDTGTLPTVRLLDPNQLAPTFEQLQQQKNYYGFNSLLDVDRYTTGGKTQDYVVAAREVELSGLAAGQQNWINTHLVYTHGVGLVAAPTNRVDGQGQPVFVEPGIAPTGPLGETQARIYFGEKSPAFSVVRTKQKEVDGIGDGQTNSYEGTGGVSIGSSLRRALFALQFRDTNLLLSSALTSDSRILYDRSPRERVAKVAPWLTVDTDPYPAVVGGRIVWILDGYTTTDAFPYSARTVLQAATADALNTGTGAQRAQQQDAEVNYIRNSVKAVVDAGDGTVKLYAFDEQDPVLKTWMKAFPGTVSAKSTIPADLAAHFRYPEDLFKVQRELLAKYHVMDPQTFFGGTDFWSVPDDPNATGAKQPPFYVLSQTQGQTAPQYNLTTSYVALNRPNLTALLSVSSGGTTPEPQSQFGHLTLLRVQPEADGVGQAQSKFNSDINFSRDRPLLCGQGSQCLFGNLLTLPVGNGVLYIEPLYVQGQGSPIPTLRKVLTSYNGRVGYGDTLAVSLDQALAGGGAVVPPTSPASPAPGSTATPTPTATGTPAAGGTPAPVPTDTASIIRALQDLQAQRAKDDVRLSQLLAALLAANGGSAPASGSPVSSPSPSR